MRRVGRAGGARAARDVRTAYARERRSHVLVAGASIFILDTPMVVVMSKFNEAKSVKSYVCMCVYFGGGRGVCKRDASLLLLVMEYFSSIALASDPHKPVREPEDIL